MESRVEGLRQFHNPFAPGVVLVGARLKPDDRRCSAAPIYVFGKGTGMSQALTRLFGEAAERDALFARLDDDRRDVLSAELTPERSIAARTVLQDEQSKDLGSTGCAAHSLLSKAAELAIFELIERHAVKLWWDSARALIPLDENWCGHSALHAECAALRAEARVARKTSFFSLGRFGAVQVVMALSQDLDGSHIAIAFAASDTLAAAARRSLLELLSVELETVEVKAAQLSGRQIDRNSDCGLAIARQQALAGSHSGLLTPSREVVPKDRPRPNSLQGLLQGLEEIGLPITLVNLTRQDINLPVCRAMFEHSENQPNFPGGFALSPV